MFYIITIFDSIVYLLLLPVLTLLRIYLFIFIAISASLFLNFLFCHRLLFMVK